MPPQRSRECRPRSLLAIAAVAACLATSSGCGEGPAADPAPAEVQVAPPPAAEAPAPLTPDERLAEEVRQAMLQAPALAREDVRIAVVNGQVFLAGAVAAPHLRDEAVAVAGSVAGVKSVQSKINVGRR
ncbi:MAG: BON domain-containing protein [Gemmatimonadetes bacterium]|nr:BON domain-containing protein [Gemmatimonadota bacterium]